MVVSRLEHHLKLALDGDANVARLIAEVSGDRVSSAVEAELVVRVLRRFPLLFEEENPLRIESPLHDILMWMQTAASPGGMAVFKRLGSPELVRLFDVMYEQIREEGACYRIESDIMLLLKMIAVYAPDNGLSRICFAARSDLLNDGYLWATIFGVIVADGHPWRNEIVDALREPLPRHFAGASYLDVANEAAERGELTRHPFDTDTGMAWMEVWLTSPDTADCSYAVSATASIPYLSEDNSAQIRELAQAHSFLEVQLEEARVAAVDGEERGLSKLQAACADPRYATIAMQYLRALGAEDRISVHTRSDDFKAMVEMCEWLADPQEYGLPPSHIISLGKWELYWPPTDDRRCLWVFSYGYDDNTGWGASEMGVGMVGSVTVALMDDTSASNTAEEVLGLHCAWELDMNGDPRAPKRRSAASGMRVLSMYNPGIFDTSGIIDENDT